MAIKMKRMLGLVACLLAPGSNAHHLQSFKATDPDAFLSFEELCSKYGFSVESHLVTTQDGYILKMFHIGTGQSFSVGIPVLLQHGLLDSADTFIVNSPDKAPGFALARQGFDVWMGNSRGNKYSRSHINYNPDTDSAYWDFSWQEMADFDVPAQVEYVLSQSDYKKLVYIGHSQGSTQMFAHLSEHVSFADKLYCAIMLNPVASVTHQTSDILAYCSKPGFTKLARMLGVREFLPASNTNYMAYLCSYFDLACKGGVYLIADELSADHYKRLDVIMNHYPSGTSLKNLQHWNQMIQLKAEAIQKYDYGPDTNLKVYSTPTPPQYDLAQIKTKLALFAGSADRLADAFDVAWLLSKLPSEAVVFSKVYLNFGHASFLWGDDFSYFETVLEVIRKCTACSE
jgi:pimeloyl-ACP methyl ester carboxylesterase